MWAATLLYAFYGGRVGECCSHMAVRGCCIRLLYTVAVRGCRTRLLYSGGSVSECCRSRCSTRSLYSDSQYAGGHCTLEVALVNAVGRIAVRVCCTLAVSTLADIVLWR